jgi:hypothetical protein
MRRIMQIAQLGLEGRRIRCGLGIDNYSDNHNSRDEAEPVNGQAESKGGSRLTHHCWHCSRNRHLPNCLRTPQGWCSALWAACCRVRDLLSAFPAFDQCHSPRPREILTALCLGPRCGRYQKKNAHFLFASTLSSFTHRVP